MAIPRLKEIRLPAGEVVGINVGWFRDGSELKIDPQQALREGFDGLKISGAGIDRTVIRADMYDGNAVCIGRHNGIVQLDSMTIVAGFSMGIQCGEQNYAHELMPKFQLRLINLKGVVPPPMPGFGRTTWWCFEYQGDAYIEGVEVDASQASEHGFYFHGFAKYGLHVKRLKMRGSGSQNLKVRSSADETAYAGALTKIHIERSSFQGAGKPWTNRGDGLIVIEGGASPIEIQDCIFRASRPDDPHAHAIMISSDANSYAWKAGAVGDGFGNGPVSIKRIAASGWLPNPWNNELVRCARNGGTQHSAPSFLLEASGIYGENMFVRPAQIPNGKSTIRGCNTPQIRDYCGKALGMNVTHEAVWPGPARRVPLSEGVTL